ncbi:hypothetical protein [Hymenobacter cellulosilyticus]|uniref:Lipoprotein n=1 Tax=Hymenobacter cellulosilyticus TaxID=2932248 RepID=A0A8T9QEC2_9BACT|nr:hypothetical protein [Hymenobacter cellulosilyticus]UOQ74498.1 hypothetical protein MUN79_11815 [Hymenobacter cellulosilyticus]
MKNVLVIWPALVLLTACHSQPTEPAQSTNAPAVGAPPAAPAPADDAEQARQWLKTSIEENFNTENRFEENIDDDNPRSIYTRQYREYKTDALQLEFAETDEEEKAFQRKWAGRYDTRYVGTGGFLMVPGQDFGKIKVTHCQLKERTKDQGFLFAVTTRDLTYKNDSKGDIKVIRTPQGYKIDDIREY